MTVLPPDRSATGEKIFKRIHSDSRDYHSSYNRLWELRLQPKSINIYPSQYAVTDIKMKEGFGGSTSSKGGLSSSMSVPNLDKNNTFGGGPAVIDDSNIYRPTEKCGSMEASEGVNAAGDTDNINNSAAAGGGTGGPRYSSYEMLSFHRRKHARHPQHLPERFTQPWASSFDYGWRYEEAQPRRELIWYPISSSPMTKFQDHLSSVGIKLKKK